MFFPCLYLIQNTLNHFLNIIQLITDNNKMSDNSFCFFLFEEFSISRFSCPNILGVLLYSVSDTVQKTKIKKG